MARRAMARCCWAWRDAVWYALPWFDLVSFAMGCWLWLAIQQYFVNGDCESTVYRLLERIGG